MYMNMFEKLFINRVNKSSIDARWFKNLVSPDSSVSDDPYGKSALAYSCISYTGRAISQVPLIEERRVNTRWEAVLNSPYTRAFENPNDVTEADTFKESLVGHLLLDGNVWVYPVFGSDKKKDIPDVWAIKQEYIKAVKKANGRLDYWKFSPSGKFSEEDNKNIIKIPASDIAHIKFWNPNDLILGQSPSKAGKLPLGSDYKASMYNDLFFENGASISGALTTDKIVNDSSFKRLTEQFTSKHQGYKNAHQIAVLDSGLKYTPMGITQKDMDYLNLRKYSREEIITLYGMKPSILGLTEKINFATTVQMKKDWWTTTNIPIMRKIQNALTILFFGKDPNRRLIFDISSIEALQDEYKEKVENYYKLVNTGVPPKDANETLNMHLPRFAGDDIGMVPMNYVPRADAASGIYAAGATVVTDESGEKATITYPAKKEVKQQEVVTKTKKQIMLELRWKSLMETFFPIEKMFESKVKRVFMEMRVASLAVIKKDIDTSLTKIQKKDLEDLEELDFLEFEDLMAAFTAAIYLLAVKEGWATMVAELGVALPFDINNVEIQYFLQTKPNKIRGIVETVRREIIASIQVGKDNGESFDQIIARIKKVYNGASNRAKNIAITEIMGSANFARHLVLVGSGFDYKRWITAFDEKVRELHAPMHEVIISIDEAWVMPNGESLEYPGDWNASAQNTVGCRCIEDGVKTLEG